MADPRAGRRSGVQIQRIQRRTLRQLRDKRGRLERIHVQTRQFTEPGRIGRAVRAMTLMHCVVLSLVLYVLNVPVVVLVLGLLRTDQYNHFWGCKPIGAQRYEPARGETGRHVATRDKHLHEQYGNGKRRYSASVLRSSQLSLRRSWVESQALPPRF